MFSNIYSNIVLTTFIGITLLYKVIDGFKNIENIASHENVSDSTTGKLANNLVIKKSIIDLKGKTYPEVEKIEE